MNLAQIFQALLDGKKITNGKACECVYLEDGVLYDENDEESTFGIIDTFYPWTEYVEPIKKMKFYLLISKVDEIDKQVVCAASKKEARKLFIDNDEFCPAYKLIWSSIKHSTCELISNKEYKIIL